MDIPWWYFIIAAIIGIVLGLWKKPGLGIFAGYVFLLLVETVLIREAFVGEHFQPHLFWSWRAWSVQKEQILTNVVVFVPVGALTGLLWKWKGLWVAVGLSAVIEVLQFISQRGLCEFDDIVHNTLGAAIGIGGVMIIKMMLGKSDNNNSRVSLEE